MQEELLARLDALAAKLGVAAEQVFEIYVRQAPLEFIDVVGWLATVATLGVLLKFFLVKLNAQEKDWYDFSWWIAAVVTSTIALLITAPILINRTVGAVKALANPEYFALTEIVKLLR